MLSVVGEGEAAWGGYRKEGWFQPALEEDSMRRGNYQRTLNQVLMMAISEEWVLDVLEFYRRGILVQP